MLRVSMEEVHCSCWDHFRINMCMTKACTKLHVHRKSLGRNIIGKGICAFVGRLWGRLGLGHWYSIRRSRCIQNLVVVSRILTISTCHCYLFTYKTFQWAVWEKIIGTGLFKLLVIVLLYDYLQRSNSNIDDIMRHYTHKETWHPPASRQATWGQLVNKQCPIKCLAD